jgi:hypothetical protein
MRVALALLTLSVAIAPAARGQTYAPGQTPAAQGLQQEQLQIQQQQARQLQQQQGALSALPGNPNLQAQNQASQMQLRQLQQQNLATQMQLQQQQRQQLQQSMTPPPSP